MKCKLPECKCKFTFHIKYFYMNINFINYFYMNVNFQKCWKSNDQTSKKKMRA